MPRALSALSILLLSGCVSSALLETNHGEVRELLTRAQTLSQCAPRDKALAEANLAFAELEMQEASARRAAEHLDIAIEHAKIVAACSPIQAPPSTPMAATVAAVATPSDSDGDGIPDSADRCPTVAEDRDGFQDTDGCPDTDDDVDGIPDSADLCPREAEDRDNYNDQDGCPEPDNDADGLADAFDACPNEPGLRERNGCPVYDRDNDGITDDRDTCPDQAELINQYLDEDGCPDTKPSRIEITGTQIVIKQRINFASGKATILPDSFPVLDDVAQAMRDYPTIRIEVAGHTDNVGEDPTNLKLSNARAQAVVAYLTAKGIAPSRLQAMGYGEANPIDTNRTEEGRLNNRRVEFNIIGGSITPGSPPTVPTAPNAPPVLPTPTGPSPWQ